MARVALLIGVSEYEPESAPIPGAVRNVRAMLQVLEYFEMSGFDEVKTLYSPSVLVMQAALETLFANRTQNDLVLLFLSGRSIKDNSGKLYFVTSSTCKTPEGELLESTTVSIDFLRSLINNSGCKHQVIILDCYFSNALGQGSATDDSSRVDIKTQLSGERQAILASFMPVPYALAQKGSDLSVYTRYLVEGLEKGAADLDEDGWISVDELHEYVTRKVQIAAPAIKPEFYPVQAGEQILLTKAPINDPKLKYRHEAERHVSHGDISQIGRDILSRLAWSSELTAIERAAIETEVLKPYREYQEKVLQYQQAFTKTIQKSYPLNERNQEELSHLLQFLGLRDEDIRPIAEKIPLGSANSSQFEDNASLLTQSQITSQLNPPSSTPSGIPLKSKQTQSILLKKLTPSVAISLKKLFLWIGMGGVLAALALVIGIPNRLWMTLHAQPENRLISTAEPGATPSSTTSLDTKSNRAAFPEREPCSVTVSGNLRSAPASFLDNIVQSVSQEQLSITGKQTEGGWIEVELPNKQLAWTHRDVVLSDEEINSCLSRNGIPIESVDDILPP